MKHSSHHHATYSLHGDEISKAFHAASEIVCFRVNGMYLSILNLTSDRLAGPTRFVVFSQCLDVRFLRCYESTVVLIQVGRFEHFLNLGDLQSVIIITILIRTWSHVEKKQMTTLALHLNACYGMLLE